MSVAAPESYLADLNEAQREAVLATEGPLLVVAGAGSGRRASSRYRVAHLIRACGVKPNEILAITFTNKAAGRCASGSSACSGRRARAIWILTFHAACGRMLRARGASGSGTARPSRSTTTGDQVRLVKACLEELGSDPKRFSPRGIHAQISRAKNELVSPEEYAAARRVVLGPDRRRGVRAVPATPARLERGRLRRPAHAHGAGLRALPRGARALAQGVPLHPRRRVPGHEPRAVPPPAAPRRRARERLRGRRPGPVDLRASAAPTSATSSSSSRTSRDAGRHARAELPLDRTRSSAPRTALIEQNTRAQAEAALLRARRGRPGTT